MLERQGIDANKKRIAQALFTGGCKKREVVDHATNFHEINRQYFGLLVVYDGNGVLLAAEKDPQYGPALFQNRFRMSQFLFKDIHEDIQDFETGCSLFMGRTDAIDRVGASSLQRMVCVLRQFAYDTGAERETEYTRVNKDFGFLGF